MFTGTDHTADARITGYGRRSGGVDGRGDGSSVRSTRFAPEERPRREV
jgi:hypothetical protein